MAGATLLQEVALETIEIGVEKQCKAGALLGLLALWFWFVGGIWSRGLGPIVYYVTMFIGAVLPLITFFMCYYPRSRCPWCWLGMVIGFMGIMRTVLLLLTLGASGV